MRWRWKEALPPIIPNRVHHLKTVEWRADAEIFGRRWLWSDEVNPFAGCKQLLQRRQVSGIRIGERGVRHDVGGVSHGAGAVHRETGMLGVQRVPNQIVKRPGRHDYFADLPGS